MKLTRLTLVFLTALASGVSSAETEAYLEGKISEVAVNGGVDSLNSGTTCIKLNVAVHAACPAGWIAIPNNNSKLINAALIAKTSATTTVVYYTPDTSAKHCPGLVYTPCAVMSLNLK